MKKEQDYIQDIAEIRSMMERSSKFLSLSGWAGILAGIYALVGAYLAYDVLGFQPDGIMYRPAQTGTSASSMPQVMLVAGVVLVLALGTAIFHSYRAARKRGERLWNPTARRLLSHMAVPFITGAVLILILIAKGMVGLVAPLSLLFYGLALYNAGKFTYEEVRIMGMVQIGLGLLGSYFVGYGLLIWAIGFGIVHMVYGVYMHYRYER